MHPMRNIIKLVEGRAFLFHAGLNSKIWSHDQLKPMIRLKLFQTAVAFYKFLDIDQLVVNDIIITGSNAAYNYTSLSDIDVHLIVDYASTSCPDLASNIFLTKKALWADTYAVKIYNFPVELYVEDAAQPVRASGVYSILHNRWLKHPSPEQPAEDDTAVENKLEVYRAAIHELLDGDPSVKSIDEMFARLKQLRQNGLLQGGEFSVENLTYKHLRNDGLIDKLFKKRIELVDQNLSL